MKDFFTGWSCLFFFLKKFTTIFISKNIVGSFKGIQQKIRKKKKTKGNVNQFVIFKPSEMRSKEHGLRKKTGFGEGGGRIWI